MIKLTIGELINLIGSESLIRKCALRKSLTGHILGEWS